MSPTYDFMEKYWNLLKQYQVIIGIQPQILSAAFTSIYYALKSVYLYRNVPIIQDYFSLLWLIEINLWCGRADCDEFIHDSAYRRCIECKLTVYGETDWKSFKIITFHHLIPTPDVFFLLYLFCPRCYEKNIVVTFVRLWFPDAGSGLSESVLISPCFKASVGHQ